MLISIDQQLLYILLWIAPTNFDCITPLANQMVDEVYALGTAFVCIERALAFIALHWAFDFTCEAVFQRQVFLKLSLSNMRSGILLTCEMLGKVNSGGLVKKDICKTWATHVTIWYDLRTAWHDHASFCHLARDVQLGDTGIQPNRTQ